MIYIPGVSIRLDVFLSGLLLFLVEDQKIMKDTLLVSYVCALVLFCCALVSCFWLSFSTSSLSMFLVKTKKTSKMEIQVYTRKSKPTNLSPLVRSANPLHGLPPKNPLFRRENFQGTTLPETKGFRT